MTVIHAIDRLKDDYKHCIRLSASNKINPKNAFDLQLIDYMQDLVSGTEDGQMNFKIASSALDVGAKIYSNRVDRIQLEAQKIASSILMAFDEPGRNEDTPNDTSTGSLNDSHEGDEDAQNKASKKKRTNRNKNVKTIVEDTTTLDAKLEKMVMGDAFLDGLSKDFDMSCPAALICYNALTQPHCLLTIESSHHRRDYRVVNSTSSPTNQYDFVALDCNKIRSLQGHICPRLEHFLFNDRTTTILGLDPFLDGPKMLNLKTTGGANEFNPQLYDNNNYDYGDDPIPDDESDDEDDPANDLIPNLDKIAASRPTDYKYSNEHHRLLNTWAGPHAWKMAKAPRTAKKDGLKNPRKRARLEMKPIDFEEEIRTSLEEIADKDIRHSSDVIRRWKKPLLPQDHNLCEDSIRMSLIHSFLRPEETYHCMKTPADALKLVDIDHDYTKSGRMDEDAPASPGLGGFDVHDDCDDEFRADPVVDGGNNNHLEFAGEHLIEQPYTVAQFNIPFAKTAKKMDIRKLKRVIWDLLPTNGKNFSNLYGELPVRVSSKMANDLSQPIAFVTLLHLANEKNLKLIPKQNLEDFTIEQDDCL